MTQEVIDKLYELEFKRGAWVSFKDALLKCRNICVKDYSHTPCVDAAWLNHNNLENWDEFQTYVLKYIDSMISTYKKEIEEL